jgi:hypothetical protein
MAGNSAPADPEFIILSKFMGIALIFGGIMAVPIVLIGGNPAGSLAKIEARSSRTSRGKKYGRAPTDPPTAAEYLLSFVATKDRDVWIGDLRQRYPQKVRQYGRRWATLWYWGQVWTCYGPILARLGRKLIWWGLFGAAAEWIRRLIP